MPKFRSHGQLDDPYQEDGDALFTGMDAFTDPTLLQEGMVQFQTLDAGRDKFDDLGLGQQYSPPDRPPRGAPDEAGRPRFKNNRLTKNSPNPDLKMA